MALQDPTSEILEDLGCWDIQDKTWDRDRLYLEPPVDLNLGACPMHIMKWESLGAELRVRYLVYASTRVGQVRWRWRRGSSHVTVVHRLAGGVPPPGEQYTNFPAISHPPVIATARRAYVLLQQSLLGHSGAGRCRWGR